MAKPAPPGEHLLVTGGLGIRPTSVRARAVVPATRLSCATKSVLRPTDGGLPVPPALMGPISVAA